MKKPFVPDRALDGGEIPAHIDQRKFQLLFKGVVEDLFALKRFYRRCNDEVHMLVQIKKLQKGDREARDKKSNLNHATKILETASYLVDLIRKAPVALSRNEYLMEFADELEELAHRIDRHAAKSVTEAREVAEHIGESTLSTYLGADKDPRKVLILEIHKLYVEETGKKFKKSAKFLGLIEICLEGADVILSEQRIRTLVDEAMYS